MKSIYLALDFASWTEAEQFIYANQLTGIPVKIGMELFYREGPDLVQRLKENGHSIFLDLKLHDIPTTVYKAMRNVGELGVDMVTIHASGGSDMIKQAKKGLIDGARSYDIPKLIAVTVLTSTNEEVLQKELNVIQTVEEQVVSLALMSYRNGADGIVCSVAETNSIKSKVATDCLTVTPGIRLVNGTQNDQVRVATPGTARDNGADILVVGRAVTQAENPREAYDHIVEEWNHEPSL